MQDSNQVVLPLISLNYFTMLEAARQSETYCLLHHGNAVLSQSFQYIADIELRVLWLGVVNNSSSS